VQLYVLFRHGSAVPVEKAGSDEARWLTPEGRREVGRVARLLPFKPSVVLTSPYTRAQETAEIIAHVWGSGVVVVDELAPGRARCKNIASLVDGEPRAVIVGHNPDLEELLCCLIGGGNVVLKPGSAAVVEVEDGWKRGRGTLVELITPELAARAAALAEKG
jgi:phosphohistidine phosphatase SixA